MRRAKGAQTVLLSWPSGAAVLPEPLFELGDFDVIVGHVSGCAILADVRQLAFYSDRRAVLDVQSRNGGALAVVQLITAHETGSFYH